MNREKIYPIVTLALCVVVTFFFAYLIYAPMQREILSMQMESRRLHAVEDDLLALNQRHGELENFSAQIETRLYEMQKFLPANSAQDSFVTELYRVAEKNNVLVNSVQIGEIVAVDENSADKKIFRQNIHLNVTANYVSTLNFLREILNGSRLVAVENISIVSGENILTGELELSIFSLSASS